ncbi:phospholipid carrier-dependent glycosyltransferase [Streptomyces axinellae]|uniref:Polyprenol-phosphate-mannose--protein mannosyltransferase n=1 Tax=Streptomyces axinellae TaxID=552788 RepID=A0ABP6CH01_9ACTN
MDERLVPPFPSPEPRVAAVFGLSPQAAVRLARWSAWGAPLLVALLAGVLRFWQLGSPHAVIFDETYYAKDAWSLLHHGYEATWPDKANDQILADPQRIPLSDRGSYVVHPPVGKWIIALGEGLFGLHPFGWRFMTALLGTLSVLMLCRIGRRLFRSTALGCLAGALMAVDGLHFVMSRAALLDLVVMFWVLAAFGCLLVDRDRTRARLAAGLPRRETESGPGTGDVLTDAFVGDRAGLGWRPWRLLAGLCLGLGVATKWNGLYVLAAFGILTVLWDMGSRRTAGAARPFLSALRKDALPAFVSLPIVALGTYVASWSGWFATSGGYFRDWADKQGAAGPWGWLPGPLRSLWHYEHEVYEFHVNLTSGHTYQSNPWSWLVLGRPVSYFYESPKAGEDGCTDQAKGCAREVLALGTPLLWWAGCLALLYVLYRWFFRRDWRAGAILCGVAAGYLPWFMYQERTIFLFYAVVFVPFVCLALAMAAGALAGPPGSSDRRRTVGVAAAGVVGLLIVWNFIYFWPIYTGQTIPMDEWRHRMWFDTWI